MIPLARFEGSAAVPYDPTFRMPLRSEIDDEGIGGCRDTWTIMDVPISEARTVVETEQLIIESVDEVANNRESFERMADLIECMRDRRGSFRSVRRPAASR